MLPCFYIELRMLCRVLMLRRSMVKTCVSGCSTLPHILQSDNNTVMLFLDLEETTSVCSKTYRLMRASTQHKQAAPAAYPSSSCPRPRCNRASTAPRALPCRSYNVPRPSSSLTATASTTATTGQRHGSPRA
jgi:hypothetical protein